MGTGTEVFKLDKGTPKFVRAGGTRTSPLETLLANTELPVGETICIRQYAKKGSASGTMYNLRKRHNDGLEFSIGPLDEYGKPGVTGLFVTKTA